MSLSYKEHRTIEVKAYSCSMSDELREAFRVFFRICGGTGRKGIEMKELKKHLNDNQYRNFAKLQHFGIIELQGKITWHLTTLGQQFYLGQATVLSPCAWMEGRTLPDEHAAWKTYRGKRRAIGINTPLGAATKTRKEYEREGRGDTLLSHEQMEAIERGKKKALAPFTSRPVTGAQQSMFDQNVTEPHNFG